MRGRLISFEGLDGSGKTTQMDLLEQWLIQEQIPYLRTREPGGTPLGLEIRRLLLDRPELDVSPLAEAFLFQADRAQHFARVVVPALVEGRLVLTDRCFDASIAYQGYARGLGPAMIRELSRLATGQRSPDLTLLLDIEASQVVSRTGQRTLNDGSEPNRLDSESERFFQQVRGAFLDLARAEPERIKVIDAARSIEQVQQDIIAWVSRLLESDR